MEKVIRLTSEQFEMLLLCPLQDTDVIEDNRELMYRDDDGCLHCLLFMTPGRLDGLLVESEGYNYCRLATYIPDASTLAYPSLLEKNQQLVKAVDYIVQTGSQKVIQGVHVFYFNDIGEKAKLEMTYGDIYPLCQMLNERMEVLDVDSDEESILVSYHPDYCPKTVEEKGMGKTEEVVEAAAVAPTLWELLAVTWEDIHLCHTDIDNAPATICELSRNTLTHDGQQAWADILAAKVRRIYQGSYGLQLELSGVKSTRLDSFSQMLAGYCSTQDYDRWVEKEQSEPGQDMIYG